MKVRSLATSRLVCRSTVRVGDYLLASERRHHALRALPNVASEITVGRFGCIGLNLMQVMPEHTNHRLKTGLFSGSVG